VYEQAKNACAYMLAVGNSEAVNKRQASYVGNEKSHLCLTALFEQKLT
jgi:hypothetical protein